MASYKIVWKASVKKDLRKIAKHEVAKIIDVVQSLSLDPKPQNSIKLTGSEFTYRLRVGKYRIIYDLFEGELCIQVIKVAKRGDAYRP